MDVKIPEKRITPGHGDENEKLVEPQLINSKTPLKKGNGNIQYGGLDDDDVPLLDYSKDDSLNVLQFVKTLTVEPVMFCFSFAFLLNNSCLTNMMMDKGCLYHLNYTKEICQNLSAYEDEKDEVEKLANNYSLYSNLMSLIAAFTMIFIAPWSDKYGRKLPLLLALFGVVCTNLGLIMCTLYFDSPLFYIVLTKIPSEVFGGIICIFTIVYSHSSEVTTEKTRTLKYTVLEIAFGLGMALGGLTGGLMYRYYGYFYVYLTGTILNLICFPWVVFVMEETRGLDVKATWKQKFCDIFACESFTKGWKASIRSRKNKERALLMLFFASMCVVVLTYESFGSLGFVYAHHIYSWGPTKYSTVNTIFSISSIVFLGICSPLLIRVFKLSDFTLGIIGTTSMMAKNTVMAFAKYSVYLYYIANVLGFGSGFVVLTARSGVSKIVDDSELGLVFSFLATCEAMFPMVGTIVLTKVFNATINVVPCISYLMTVVFLLLPLGTFLWAYKTFSKSPQPKV